MGHLDSNLWENFWIFACDKIFTEGREKRIKRVNCKKWIEEKLIDLELSK